MVAASDFDSTNDQSPKPWLFNREDTPSFMGFIRSRCKDSYGQPIQWNVIMILNVAHMFTVFQHT